MRYLAILFLALATSLTFCFVIYPHIADLCNAPLDDDNYGQLGIGLYRSGTLSYYPHLEPTVKRGPAYPALVAISLYLTGGWYPGGIQTVQCLLFAGTCLLAAWLASIWGGQRAGSAAGIAVALHPYIIWWLPRIFIETLAGLLFTLAVLLAVRRRHVALGLVLGLAILCKATFAPVALAIVALLWRQDRRRTLWTVALAALLVMPWIARCYALTGHIVPVQALAGYNFLRGDTFVENFDRLPYSYAALWTAGEEKMRAAPLPADAGEVARDRAWMRASLNHYREDPGFLAKKVLLNAVFFWTLGQTSTRGAVLGTLQLMLLALFAWASMRALRRRGWSDMKALPLMAVLAYYLPHLPIFAFARLSVVMVPIMMATVAAEGVPFIWSLLPRHDGLAAPTLTG